VLLELLPTPPTDVIRTVMFGGLSELFSAVFIVHHNYAVVSTHI